MIRQLRPPQKLEKKLFEIICVIQMIVLGHGAIQAIVVYGPIPIFFFDSFVFLQGGLFFYLSYKKGMHEKLITPMIIILFAFITLFWILLGGYTGQTAYAAIAVGVIAIVLSRDNHRVLALASIIILLTTLVLVQEKTNWVDSDQSENITLYIDYIILSCAVFFITFYVKNEYDKERSKNHKRKQKLEKLNLKLSKMLVEKEEAIEELRKTRDKLIESEKLASVGKLTSGLAYELSNPLNYIGGVARPIKRDLSDLKKLLEENIKDGEQLDEASEILDELQLLTQQIDQGANKANQIVGNLKKYIPSSNGYDKYLSLTNLTMELESLITNLSEQNPGISFSLECPPDLELNANKFDLDQAFVNIIENSIQAISENSKGKIDIVVREDKSSYALHFSDNGIGINSKDLKEIFEPFFTTRDKGQGMGLGLFSTFNIIKKHGGEIKAQSKPGQGTSIHILLPIH